jgi:glucan-binding YG repeat protein
MFKRANKITALLVAAASIMSVVPAMASERLGTKDGTLNYGIAYDGGKYVYDGYRTDDDNTGIYFNSGDKDKLIPDLEDYKINGVDSKYGTKYLLAKDGSDQYLVDLSTGKVLDNETDEEKRDTIQGKLRSTLKKTDRYALTENFDNVKVGDRLFAENKQFGDVWYMYSALGDGTYTDATTTGSVKPSVKLALPIKQSEIVALAEANKTVQVFGKTITPGTNDSVAGFESRVQTAINDAITDSTKNVVASYAAGVVTITSVNGTATAAKTSDADYATIKAALKTVKGDVTTTFDQGYTGLTKNDKISYAGFVNGDGKYIDASNLANIYGYSYENDKVVKIEEYNKYNKDNKMMVALDSIEAIAQDKDYIYAITTATIYYGDTEATCTQNKHDSTSRTAYFYQKIAKAQGDKKDDAYIPKTVDSYEIHNKDVYDNGDSQDAYKVMVQASDDGYDKANNMYTVKDGNLYVVRIKSDKVKIFKMKTTKAKVDATNSITKTKLDAPLVQKTGDGDHDIYDGSSKRAVSLDVNGNVWALDKGTIYKVDGTTFKEMYTLDRSIDNLDVYNDGSLIAWENNGSKNGKVYTTVTEGKAKTSTEAPAATPAKTGWDKLADGTWNLYDATGAKVVNNWSCIGGSWYYFKADGVMVTGWQQVNGTWYLLNASGAMATGWQQVGGTWYFLQPSGAMKTGWLNDNGTWYYLNASAAGAR